MNSGDSAGLGGPLKKPAAKPEAKKPLGGLGGGGKSIGGDAPAPAAPAPTAAPASFEFEDEPAAPKAEAKKAAAPAAFNPFDEPVKVPAANATAAPAPTAPGTGRVEKPGTGRVEKPGTGRVEKPGTGRTEKTAAKAPKPAVDPADADIAPGTAKDLWTCPHCGAKNKPTRETCRECKKSPHDPVEKPWFLQPMIIGPVAGGLVLVIVLIMWLTSVDLSLRPAGTVDKAVRSAGTTQSVENLDDTRKFFIKKDVAVSGRVIATNDYAVAPWLQAVVVGLGSSASDDAVFSTWTAEYDGEGYSVKAPKYATLFLIHSGNKPTLKPGDYISVVGKGGVPEQDNAIVKGTDNANCWTIKVTDIQTR